MILSTLTIASFLAAATASSFPEVESTAGTSAPLKCSSDFIKARALNVDIYSYPSESNMGWEDSFFNGDWKTTDYLFSTWVRENMSFRIENNKWTNIFNYNIHEGNLTLEYNGYFFAAETGPYKFEMAASSGAEIRMGDKKTCCDYPDHSVDEGSKLNVIVSRESEGSETNSHLFLLEEGHFYPMRIVYFNQCCMMNLNINYTTPSKIKHSDLALNTYQLNLEGKCQGRPNATTSGAN